jgi:hypothetical protein
VRRARPDEGLISPKRKCGDNFDGAVPLRPVAIVDISWGACVTAVASTAGLVGANWLAPKF